MNKGRYIGPPIGVSRLCEFCKKPHFGTYRTGRFCSRKCGIAQRVAAAHRPEAIEKLKASHAKIRAEGGFVQPVDSSSRAATTAWLKQKWQDPVYRRKMSNWSREHWKNIPAEERSARMKKVSAAKAAKGATACQ